jgi:hypothetical protein
MVEAGRLQAESPVVDVSAWAAGYYLMRIETSTGVQVMRFMKGSAD